MGVGVDEAGEGDERAGGEVDVGAGERGGEGCGAGVDVGYEAGGGVDSDGAVGDEFLDFRVEEGGGVGCECGWSGSCFFGDFLRGLI